MILPNVNSGPLADTHERSLVVFGEDWGALPSSTGHLIRQLVARHGYRVVWINSIGLRRPRLNRADLTRVWRKLSAGFKSARVVNAEMTGNTEAQPMDPQLFAQVHPKTLPLPRTMAGRYVAAWLLERQIKPVMATLGMKKPILWTSLPSAVDMAGRLGESALVYYCGDDFSALAGVDHAVVSRREQQLVEKADLILAASKVLHQRFPSVKSSYLPHGVDFELFAMPAPRAADLPNDGRPIAGFYGSISDWLDFELLEGAIQTLPDWHFVFVGSASRDCASLARYGNVHFLGPRAHHELPSYVQHWSASLLPFVDSAQIRACNPLKLREYLAAGRPVVATPFPALNDYRGAIEPVRSVDELAAALRQVAARPLNRCAQAQVQSESWGARADQLHHDLQLEQL
jgi:glycosyltransferase involved in cell wall biosynthesis